MSRKKSKARRAASKAKSKSKSSLSSSKSSTSSSSKSSSSSSSSSSTKKYETTDGKKFSDKSAATAHQRDLNDKGKGRGSSYDVNLKDTKVKETKEEDDDEERGGSAYVKADDTELRNSDEFKALSKDDQEAVLAVFGAIASNDAAQANRLAGAFKAATKLNDPYFNEQLRIATDAIERGYVEIDKEAEFKEIQLKRRRDDLRADYEKRKEYLTLEQATNLRAIERDYTTELDETRQNLAATGKTSSSQRVQKEQMLEESFGDLRASTNRKFAFEIDSDKTNVERTDRDVQTELSRLAEITKAGKLDFLRKAEERVGSKNLSRLSRLDPNYKPLGNVYGDIERNRIQDTLASATSFVF